LIPSASSAERGKINGSALKWTEERFKHIINLKEEALNKGREIWADFVWVILQLLYEKPQIFFPDVTDIN